MVICNNQPDIVFTSWLSFNYLLVLFSEITQASKTKVASSNLSQIGGERRVNK